MELNASLEWHLGSDFIFASSHHPPPLTTHTSSCLVLRNKWKYISFKKLLKHFKNLRTKEWKWCPPKSAYSTSQHLWHHLCLWTHTAKSNSPHLLQVGVRSYTTKCKDVKDVSWFTGFLISSESVSSLMLENQPLSFHPTSTSLKEVRCQQCLSSEFQLLATIADWQSQALPFLTQTKCYQNLKNSRILKWNITEIFLVIHSGSEVSSSSLKVPDMLLWLHSVQNA